MLGLRLSEGAEKGSVSSDMRASCFILCRQISEMLLQAYKMDADENFAPPSHPLTHLQTSLIGYIS